MTHRHKGFRCSRTIAQSLEKLRRRLARHQPLRKGTYLWASAFTLDRAKQDLYFGNCEAARRGLEEARARWKLARKAKEA